MDEHIKKRGTINKRWSPVKWEPIYEQFIAFSAIGYSNKDIAEKFGYTPQQVSNVLCTPQAKVIKEQLIRKIREDVLANSAGDREALIHRANENIGKVLNSDELREKSPFKMLEASMSYLKGVGQLESESKGTTIMINTQVANILQQGLTKSDEVKKLHNPDAAA